MKFLIGLAMVVLQGVIYVRSKDRAVMFCAMVTAIWAATQSLDLH